jgi:hypothetical protein
MRSGTLLLTVDHLSSSAMMALCHGKHAEYQRRGVSFYHVMNRGNCRSHIMEERLPRRNAKDAKKRHRKTFIATDIDGQTRRGRRAFIYAKWRVAGLVWGLARLTQIPAGNQRSGGFSRRFSRDASNFR